VACLSPEINGGKAKYGQLYYQGFFGMTAMNPSGSPPANDIDLKMVEFYNLDAHYYQDVDLEKLHLRDYFRYDRKQAARSEAAAGEPPVTTNSLAAEAKDLLAMKREVEKAERVEISSDLSNVIETESFDETLFKVFEQLKAYNNRLSTFNKG
jgi:hypothetical protein